MPLLNRGERDGRVKPKQRTNLDRLNEREIVERDEADKSLSEETARRESLLVLDLSARTRECLRTARRMM